MPAPEIQSETPASASGQSAIRAVHAAAFGRPDEADLVDALRAQGYAILSLVATIGGRVTGHILFSRMWIKTTAGLIPAISLAPVAVLPEYQRQGIGSRLIERGLEMLRERGEAIAIVLGHPDYYPKFGFSAAKAAPLLSPFPPEAFLAMELRAGALDGIEGRVIYPPPFGI